MSKYLVDLNLHKHDKMYGTTTIGARGQIVIPAQARKDLGLKSGDQLLVMGKYGKVLGFMKADQFSEVIDVIMSNIGSVKWKKELKKRMEKLINSTI